MKKTLSVLFFIGVLIHFSSAQIFDPVTWEFSTQRTSEDKAELVIKATIEENWHLYSQFLPTDEGPIATSFSFDKNANYSLEGAVKESESITKFDPVNAMELTFFEHEAVFTQTIHLLTDQEFKITGFLEFMVCDDKRCLPPETIDFDFLIASEKDEKPEENAVSETNTVSGSISEMSVDEAPQIFDPVAWTFGISHKEGDEYEISLEAIIDEGWHLYSQNLPPDDGPIPTSFSFVESDGIKLVGKVVATGEMKSEYDPNFMMDLDFFEKKVVFKQTLKLSDEVTSVKGELEYMVCNDKMCLPPEVVEFDVPVADGEDQAVVSSDSDSEKSFWAIFLEGFFGGFAALIMPCIYPMIPLTVSFFTKQSKTKRQGVVKSIIYGLSIIGIYVALGMLVTIVFGSDALNRMSTNPWFNILFFLLFVVFAFSFFGAFEITLPSSWVNKADTASNRGGLIGIFFMAFTLSLVSFSCTGPIIGTLLVRAADGSELFGPAIGMFGFSLALAIPFALFAAFPGWLNTLPQSGGWLNTVKVTLGFLELALALKFLSNADMVVQAGYLKRELFLAIWIGIFLLTTLYLLGVFRMPHDTKVESLSVTRLMFATVFMVFTIYLIPGMWGAPLKLISAFPPPQFYSEAPSGLGGGGAVSAPLLTASGEVIGEPEHCPHNLPCFHDYDEGLAYARESGKPVMLDFTGWACVNCRRMEQEVWSDPRVLKRLRDEFVLVSLYVDEDIALPPEEQIEVEYGGKKKKLRTVGNKWSYLEASKYGTNAQPHYIIMDHNENTMNGSAAYDPDIEKFIQWLDEGRSKFLAGQKQLTSIH